MKLFSLFLFLSLLSVQSFAIEYPELMVSPRATERLKIEATREEDSNWSTHLPLHVAGATTLLAGALSLSNLDKDKDAEGIGSKVAIAVGASWLAASIWLQTSYWPYSYGHQDVRRLPYKSARDQLAAERFAEEKIDSAARLAKKIKWLSFGSNFIASMAAASSAEEDSVGQGVSALAALTSFLPLVFPYKWEQVSEDQRSYKKKVFGPISFGNAILINPVDQKPTLGFIAGTYF